MNYTPAQLDYAAQFVPASGEDGYRPESYLDMLTRQTMTPGDGFIVPTASSGEGTQWSNADIPALESWLQQSNPGEMSSIQNQLGGYLAQHAGKPSDIQDVYQQVARGLYTPTNFDQMFSTKDGALSDGEFALYSPDVQAWAKANPQQFAQSLLANRNQANGDLGSVGAAGGYMNPGGATVNQSGTGMDMSNAGYMPYAPYTDWVGTGILAAGLAATGAAAFSGYGALGAAQGAGASSGLSGSAVGMGGGTGISAGAGGTTGITAGGTGLGFSANPATQAAFWGNSVGAGASTGLGASQAFNGYSSPLADGGLSMSSPSLSSTSGLGLNTGVQGIGTNADLASLNGLGNGGATASFFPGASNASIAGGAALPSISDVAANGMLGSLSTSLSDPSWLDKLSNLSPKQASDIAKAASGLMGSGGQPQAAGGGAMGGGGIGGSVGHGYPIPAMGLLQLPKSQYANIFGKSFNPNANRQYNSLLGA
jgi:hypothetical protein